MLNHIVLMGRLTRDPELRHTQTGTAVASFTLAVDRDYQSKGKDKETDFIYITAWRNTADFVSSYFSKGRMAIVEGRLEIQKFKDREGNNRQKAVVIAENVYFGDSKKSDGQSGGQSYPSQDSSGAPDYGDLGDFQEYETSDDKLPF